MQVVPKPIKVTSASAVNISPRFFTLLRRGMREQTPYPVRPRVSMAGQTVPALDGGPMPMRTLRGRRIP